MKKVVFLALLYPFLLISFVALPLEIWHAYDIPLSEQASIKVLEYERQALGISSDVPLNLVLVEERGQANTSWARTNQLIYFTIKITRDSTSQNTIQHEMYHVARILRCDIQAERNWLKKHWFRYLYVEEPLAIVYEYFGFDLG